MSVEKLLVDFSFCELEARTKEIVDSSKYLSLRNNIINHPWKLRRKGIF